MSFVQTVSGGISSIVSRPLNEMVRRRVIPSLGADDSDKGEGSEADESSWAAAFSDGSSLPALRALLSMRNLRA